jgi:hypothetical protein
LWFEYTQGKQTYSQLASKYNCSAKTIQRRIDEVIIPSPSTFPKETILLIDTTYFGRAFGVMVFRDNITGQVLYWQFVKQETLELYKLGIEEIARRGIKIIAIVCDGKRGLLNYFDDVLIQMCNFHQIAIIRRYLTKKPKMEASKELWLITLRLTKEPKLVFELLLKEWKLKWDEFLSEHSFDVKGKKKYKHKKLRSAIRSLNTNLKWLYTWEENTEHLIPKTTNAIDGMFADLKNKLRNHNGLSVQRKMKFVAEFFLHREHSKVTKPPRK